MPAKAALALLATATGAWLALHLAASPVAGLAEPVHQQLHRSGVEHAVTAVLLNFRGLDTLYEVAVLALAALATLSLEPTDTLAEGPRPAPLLEWLVPRLLPVVVVFAGYLWWAGSTRPGGAFQAGTTLAGLLLLLALSRRHVRLHDRLARAVEMAGPLVFLLVGVATAVAGRAFLEYPEGAAKPLIVAIEGLLTASIGLILALLAAGGRQQP